MMRLPCRLSMHNLILVELTGCYILTTERTGGQEKVMRLPCRLSMHYLSLVELTGCYILTTERTGQEKVMRLPCRLSMHYLSLVELSGPDRLLYSHNREDRRTGKSDEAALPPLYA